MWQVRASDVGGGRTTTSAVALAIHRGYCMHYVFTTTAVRIPHLVDGGSQLELL